MKIYTHSTIGQFHTNHNEDFLVTAQLDTNQYLIAVMDGCTMGTESYFASTLAGKILRLIAKHHFYSTVKMPHQLSLQALLKQLCYKLFQHLRSFQLQLDLRTEELLSTLILGVVESNTHQATFITIGDGILYSDGDLIFYDQDNKPDYIGYHLQESFEAWYCKQEQRLQIKDFQTLSIATDGIYTFHPFRTSKVPSLSDEAIINFLLQEDTAEEQKDMLRKKIIQLEDQYGLKPTDDLSIIRIIA